MKNTYFSLVALAVAAASLSSCSRANYAFNPNVPAYLGTTTHTVAKAVVVTAPATVVAAPVAAAPTAASAPAVVASTPVSVPVAARPVVVQAAPAAAALVVATTATPTAKPNLVQRLTLKRVLKSLTKAEARQQNTASTTHTAAKASLYLGIAAIGLVLLIIGLIAGSGFLDTIGAIAIVVGLIIFIFNNI